jgi:hypothetical protein
MFADLYIFIEEKLFQKGFGAMPILSPFYCITRYISQKPSVINADRSQLIGFVNVGIVPETFTEYEPCSYKLFCFVPAF